MQGNIVLVGFMGTGKSAVGRLLAKRLSRRFVDMDSVIEEREGRAISEIFASDGEAAFRGLERALVRGLAAESGLVVATGGGVVLDESNIEAFSRTGTVVCLHATPETILERVGHQSHRPLLEDGEKRRRILELLEARHERYASIPHGVDTTALTVEQVADRVEEIARRAQDSDSAASTALR